MFQGRQFDQSWHGRGRHYPGHWNLKWLCRKVLCKAETGLLVDAIMLRVPQRPEMVNGYRWRIGSFGSCGQLRSPRGSLWRNGTP
jgi:hypothetical protein